MRTRRLGLLAAAALTLVRSASPPIVTSVAPATAASRVALPAAGVGIGVLTGLVGVGGGFLIVPALVSLGRYPVARAVPMSLFVIACSASTAAVGYRDVAVDWATAAVMAVAAAAGVIGGGAYGRRLDPRRLQQLLAVVLVAAAASVFLFP